MDTVLPSNQLYISQFKEEITEKDLKEIFETQGNIISFQKRLSKTNQVYALCTYESISEAAAALQNLGKNGPIRMRIKFANKMLNNENTPRGHNKDKEKNYSGDSRPPSLFRNIYKEGAQADLVVEEKHSGKTTEKQNVAKKSSSENRNSDKMESNCCVKDMMKTEHDVELMQKFIDMEIAQRLIIKSELDTLVFKNQETIVPEVIKHENDYVPKKSLDKELFSAQSTVEETFQLILQYELYDNKWVGAVITSDTKEMYYILCNEFIQSCADASDGVKKPVSESEMAAVELVKNEWYRAYMLPNKSWALIDDGRILSPSEVINVIKCPEKYMHIPAFCCILRCKVSLKHSSKQLECNVLWNDTVKNIVVVSIKTNGQTIHAILEAWDPVVEYQNVLNESEVVKPDDNNCTEPKSVTRSNRLVLVSKDCVKLVHFENCDNIYLRLADNKSNRVYNKNISIVCDHGETAPSLKSAPKRGDIVLCEGIHEDEDYYRAVIIGSNTEDDTYQMTYLDHGRTVKRGLGNLKECDVSVQNLPKLITKVKLEGMEGVAPNMRVLDYVQELIECEIHFVCTFKGSDHRNVGVQLRSKIDNVSVNDHIKSLMAPITERLVGTITDQPVLLANSIDTIPLEKVDTSVIRPQLIVTDISQLMDKHIMCTLNDSKMQRNYAALFTEMNNYCKTQKDHYLPRVEEICLALFEEDNNYYRAVVQACCKDQLAVLFIDYGNTAVVNIKNVRKILSEFVMSVPQMANPCYLTGLPDKMQASTLPKIKEYFKEKKSAIHVTSIECINNVYHIHVPALLSYLTDLP